MTRSAIRWATAFLLLAAAPVRARPTLAPSPIPLPDLSAILPSPPAPDSLMHRNDLQRFTETRALRSTERWRQAARDADLRPASVLANFAGAAGLPPAAVSNAAMLRLLAHIEDGAKRMVEPEKRATRVVRPFIGNDELLCVPRAQAPSRSFAYPSGHAAIGWAVALILAELRPEHATAILERGMAFGESRVICGLHWRSDVEAGRVAGAALAASLHGDPDFRNELAAAGRALAGTP